MDEKKDTNPAQDPGRAAKIAQGAETVKRILKEKEADLAFGSAVRIARNRRRMRNL